MTRIPVVFVALLIVTAPLTAIAGGASLGAQTATEADSNEDDLPENIAWVTTGTDATTGTSEPSSDLGSALAMGDTEFQHHLDVGTVEQEFEALDSSQEQEELLNDTLDQIEQRSNELHEREEAIVEAYRNDEVDERTVVREFAEISNEASALSDAAAQIDSIAQTDAEVSVSVRNVRGELTRFDTPLRTTALDATNGDTTGSTPIQVSAGEDAVVLHAVEDSTYEREAVQFDQHSPDQESTFEGLTELEDRGPELYPWIYSNSLFEFEWGISGYVSLVGLTLDHPRGDTTSYVDTTTQNVVMEYHTLDLSELPTTTTVSSSNENATISSNRVADGGPVWVSVTDSEGEEPVEATIAVDGEPQTQTDEDGTAWVVAPEGDVSITATTDEGENSMTVREPSS